VVCWIKRARRLGISVPLDASFEKELMQSVEARTHKELEDKLRFLHDETFEAIVESILKRRRRRVIEQEEVARGIYL